MSDNFSNEAITLGTYIAQKRQATGLSQRELAKDIQISHSTISRIEKDDGISPDNATLRALANRLNLDYNFLLALNKSIDDEPEIRVIQRAAKKMNPEQKQKMLNILKASFDDLFEEDKNAE
ncbi:helix-turn-helix domain-containing protein [Heliorestis convoluta]|uniref:Putative XRE family transcriptional regulator n=1 Tax=Heliorestis convoluta TaxID=356322 RepID=A0A5Q2MZ76_9FIRM|nr:helix-turn-helix transcriptional regulator [Heliorestis convoluta]QGG47321.1 putative XRE family transcriptional regulator [Heliorestis convoluta]